MVEGSSAGIEVNLSNRFLTDVTIPFTVSGTSTAQYRFVDEDGLRGDGDYYIVEDSDEEDGDGYLFDPETLTGSITIFLGETSRIIPIVVNDDSLQDGDATESAIETLILEIPADAFHADTTEGSILSHTLLIQDNDITTDDTAERLTFDRNTNYQVGEDEFVVIPLNLSTALGENTDLIYSISFADATVPASQEDVYNLEDEVLQFIYDPEDATNLDFTGQDRIQILTANSGQISLVIGAYQDRNEEEPESFLIRLESLSTTIDENNPDQLITSYSVDPDPIEVFILDSELGAENPSLYFDVSGFEGGEKSQAILERTEARVLTVRLSEAFAEDIFVPISFSAPDGTIEAELYDTETFLGDYTTSASRADDSVFSNFSEFDQALLPEIFVYIPRGEETGTLIIASQSDGEIEKHLTVELGDDTYDAPFFYDDNGDEEDTTADLISLQIELGTDQVDSYDFVFPAKVQGIGFGRDTSTLNSSIESDGALIRATRSVLSETDGTIFIPIYLEIVPDESVDFTVEIFTNDGDNPAVLYDFSRSESVQEDWDARVSVGNQPLESIDDSADVSTGRLSIDGLPFDYEGNFVRVELNNDEEDPVPYSEFENYLNGDYTGIEGSENNFEPYEETIRLRITKTNEDSPDVLPESAEYEVIIRELPDIDLTDAYASGSLTPSAPVFNAMTGLYEAQVDFTPPPALQDILEAWEDTQLAGYKAYKMAFTSYKWDENDPENSDPLAPRLITTSEPNGFLDTNFVPNRINPFYYGVERPFGLRFPAALTAVVLLEGIERSDDQLTFELTNADTVAFRDDLFVPLSLPDVDPDPTIGDTSMGGAFRPLIPTSDEMQFNLEFVSFSEDTVDLSRLSEPGNIQVFLSTDTYPSTGLNSGFTGTIYSVQELPDGRVYVDLTLPSAADVDPNVLGIEYLTEDGEWISVQPVLIQRLGSQFLWIDQGPPATWPHPRDVDMRLYRFSNISN